VIARHLVVSVFLYFSRIACILGHLSSDEWLIQMFLFGLCLLYIEQLIHLYDLGSAVQVGSCAQWAYFFSSAVAMPVIKPGQYEASCCYNIVVDFAYLPP